MTEPEIRVVRIPMLDTGLGREAGFANDAELVEHAKREREALSPAVRELVDELDAELERRVLAELERRVLFGEGPTS